MNKEDIFVGPPALLKCPMNSTLLVCPSVGLYLPLGFSKHINAMEPNFLRKTLMSENFGPKFNSLKLFYKSAY